AATDPAPHRVEEKEAEFDQAPFGTIGFETALAAVLTYLVEPGELTLSRAIEALSTTPARILGAGDHGGPVEPGRPANLVVFDPSAHWAGEPPLAPESRPPRGAGRPRPPRHPPRLRPVRRMGGRTTVRLEEPELRLPRTQAAGPGRAHDAPGGARRGRREGAAVNGGPAAVLVLEDGSAFRGTGFGATGEGFGEAVFNTAMSGYQEVLTDPSYAGQVVAMTAP